MIESLIGFILLAVAGLVVATGIVGLIAGIILVGGTLALVVALVCMARGLISCEPEDERHDHLFDEGRG